MAPQNMKPRYFKQTGTMPAQIHTRSQMCQKKTRQPGVTARYSEMVCPNSVRGMDHLKDPRLNKGLAFTLEERQALGIHGLLASQVLTQKEQVEICRLSVERYKRDLNKYLYLSELQDTNERLFFSLLDQDIEKYLPIVYTPVVGLACQRFGLTYRRPRGLFITINDKDHIFKVLNNWPENDVRAICFTDGERVLGLGDLGAYGMGIPVGKLSLYTALAGIKPHQCLPILLDVGTENTSLLEDPLYIGIRQKRVRGQQYDDFIEEFMTSCVHRFGRNVLLQFEDFAWNNATRLLNKYKDNYCTFNDDIQGTAGAAVAGFLAATRISKKKISENVVMFFGAGSAACGIGNLTVAAMVEEGLSKKEALERVFLFDLDGLLTSQRPKGVPNHAKNFERDLPPENDFMKCLTTYKPTCLIGCSTVGGAFTPEILKQMSQNAERPIIFALSNPTPQAECTAQAAYDNTEGRCIFASGSPFPPVNYNGKEYRTGQGNNSYIFPGLALGVIATRAYCIPDALFLIAARSLANQVSPEDLEAGRIYPPLSDLKKLSFDLAMEVAKSAYETDIATRYPIPQNFEAFIKKKIYDLNYPSYLPEFYKYPVPPEIKVKSVEEVHRAILRRHDKRKRIKGLWIVFSMIVFILHSLQNIGEGHCTVPAHYTIRPKLRSYRRLASGEMKAKPLPVFSCWEHKPQSWAGTPAGYGWALETADKTGSVEDIPQIFFN